MRFAFIHAMVAEKAPYSIATLCRNLDVSRQGYYAYVLSLQSPRIAEEIALREHPVQVAWFAHGFEAEVPPDRIRDVEYIDGRYFNPERLHAAGQFTSTRAKAQQEKPSVEQLAPERVIKHPLAQPCLS